MGEETTTGSLLVTEWQTTVSAPKTKDNEPSNDALLIDSPEAQELINQGAIQDGEKLILDKSNTLSQEDKDIAQFFNDLMNDNLETTTWTTRSSSTTGSKSSTSSTSSSNLSRQDIQQIEMLLKNLIQ